MSDTQINLSNLRKASRDPVVEALSFFPPGRVTGWLDATHPGRFGQLIKNERTLKNYRDLSKLYSFEQLAQLLAATAPNHCMDGWSYLSRAIDAYISGHLHLTRHMAYYAQLRAALSILAHCGIGIFNTINFVVGDDGNIHRLDSTDNPRGGMGTHLATWKALENWSTEPQMAGQFLKSISIQGSTLKECIQAVCPTALESVLVSDIVTAWGLDLRRGAKDRETRNISSYSAHALNPIEDPVIDRLKLVEELWSTLEPGLGDGFAELDRYLLRKLLRLALDIQKDPEDEYLDNHTIEWRYRQLDQRVREIASMEFLLGPTEVYEPLVMKVANDKTEGTVRGMICRAILLLRTAMGFTRTAFVEAGFDPLGNDMIKKWLEATGEVHGFWETGSPPVNMGDLWDVVNYALEDLQSSIDESPDNQYSWMESAQTSVRFLSQAERACMWGVCP